MRDFSISLLAIALFITCIVVQQHDNEVEVLQQEVKELQQIIKGKQ